MLQLLASLFALIEKALGLYHDAQVEEQGRQKVEEKLDANVAHAAEAVSTPDPVRDERLRHRFDEASGGSG